MTGTTWLEEGGFLEGPVMITNTHSVGVVRDAVIAWRVAHGPEDNTGAWWSLPVVAETWDGWLNDINGFHVKPEHVFQALEHAHAGAVEEGNVGGGTGMICNGYKGGIGTASRRLDPKDGGYTVGVLVQCNYGTRENLRVAGIPVGHEIFGEDPYAFVPADVAETGSIIVVVATDAPLLPHQLKRVARRVTLGLGRTGSTAGNGSGDIFIAFSTANPEASVSPHVTELQMLPNGSLDPIFRRDRAGDGGSGYQRARRRRGHDRHRRPPRDRALAPEAARSARALQPPGQARLRRVPRPGKSPRVSATGLLFLPREDALPVVLHADNHPAALLRLAHEGVGKVADLRLGSISVFTRGVVVMHEHLEPRPTAVLGVFEHLLVAAGVAERRQRPPPDHQMDADGLAVLVIDAYVSRLLGEL